MKTDINAGNLEPQVKAAIINAANDLAKEAVIFTLLKRQRVF